MGAYKYQTPRFVWLGSAIAATTLHAIGLAWLRTAWQSGRIATPSPIQVIAISNATAIPTAPTALPSASPTTPPTVPQAPVAQDFSDSQPAAVPNSTPASPSSAAAPAQTPIFDSAPSANNPAPTLEPAPQDMNTQPPVALPPTNSPTNLPPPTNTDESPATPAWRLAATFTSRRLEEGSDFADIDPVFTQQWQTAANAALAEAACFRPSLLITPVVILRPTVEADGRISNILLEDSQAIEASPELVQCIASALTSPTLPPVRPAIVGGAPVRTDRVLLEVEGRFSE